MSADSPQRSGNAVALGFGFDAYFSLVVAGLFGMIPWVAWLSPVLALVPERLDPVVNGLLGGAIAFIVVVCPWLVPVLVLRARQPAPAELRWDAEGVSSWLDGKRETFIPWARLMAGRMSWEVRSRQREVSRRRVAIQLTDRGAPASVITVWEAQPPRSPPARRRMANEKLSRLEHRISEFTEPVELSRVADHARRPVAKWKLSVMRLGYVVGTLAPLLGRGEGAVGLALASTAAALLLWRASPVVREIVTLQRSGLRVSPGAALELACRVLIAAAPLASTLLAVRSGNA